MNNKERGTRVHVVARVTGRTLPEVVGSRDAKNCGEAGRGRVVYEGRQGKSRGGISLIKWGANATPANI